MDFLFVSLLTWAKEQKYSTFNLGLSALSGVGEHADAAPIERALLYIYKNVNRFYNFRGLHAFKEKFHPIWSPRYLIYPSPASLPTVSVALIRAQYGSDMLSLLRQN
jgi:phosphatidylglycerol lysyltransferase